tara:strand:+ start:383 stop:568 length:186 start_codon:yes stop_codon:yes gene_type:complete
MEVFRHRQFQASDFCDCDDNHIACQFFGKFYHGEWQWTESTRIDMNYGMKVRHEFWQKLWA